MDFKKQLANPGNLRVRDIINEPKVGDKIKIRDYSLFSPNEVAKITKMLSITILEVDPIVVGTDGIYHWGYTVTTTADPLQPLLPSMYQIIT